jgi:hypothetical protein
MKLLPFEKALHTGQSRHSERQDCKGGEGYGGQRGPLEAQDEGKESSSEVKSKSRLKLRRFEDKLARLVFSTWAVLYSPTPTQPLLLGYHTRMA